MAHATFRSIDSYYAFQGGMPTLTAGVIAEITNCPLSHVALIMRFRYNTRVTLHDNSVVLIPVGTYAFHATNHTYETSVGPHKTGVVLTPIGDVMKSYIGGTWITVYPSDPQREGTLQDRLSFMRKYWGDPYGMYFMANPVCIVTGEFPDHMPVCTTLVGSWLKARGYFHRTEYEGPGGLLRKMLASKYFTMRNSDAPRLPVDSIIVLAILLVIVLVVSLLRSWS